MYFVNLKIPFKASYFHWYGFPFHFIQSANTEFLLMETQRLLTLQQIKNMSVIVKTSCLLFS